MVQVLNGSDCHGCLQHNGVHQRISLVRLMHDDQLIIHLVIQERHSGPQYQQLLILGCELLEQLEQFRIQFHVVSRRVKINRAN